MKLTENEEPSGNAIYRFRRDNTFGELIPFAVALNDVDDVLALALLVLFAIETFPRTFNSLCSMAHTLFTVTIKTRKIVVIPLACNTLSMTDLHRIDMITTKSTDYLHSSSKAKQIKSNQMNIWASMIVWNEEAKYS